MTATESNPYPRIKAYERREIERLDTYLKRLDAAGWVEQSYCSDWPVYQVVSHIGSGSRIGGLRVRAWLGTGEPVSRETMQQVWGHFDSLGPEQMYAAFADATREYLEVEASTPDAEGLREVDGFAGKRPLYAYQISRTWELACHSWDVYVARDPLARLDPEAVDLLASNLQYVSLPLDRERASALQTKPIAFELGDSGRTYFLDPSVERPRLSRDGAADAPLVIRGPDEEMVRLISGRHFVPGARTQLEVSRGSTQDLNLLRRALK